MCKTLIQRNKNGIFYFIQRSILEQIILEGLDFNETYSKDKGNNLPFIYLLTGFFWRY